MALTSPRSAETIRESAGPRPGAGEKHLPTARIWTGRILGPVLALLAYFLIPEDPALTDAGRATAAVVILVAVWWMTEALPLSATALVPIVALPFLGVMPVDEAAAPYASPTVFLFMGGFMIALAMQKWNLHMRIALLTMRLVGTRPRRIVLGVMIATAFLSMWVSNTATTMMMLPIGMSVLAMAAKPVDGEDADGEPDPAVKRFGVTLMLAIAFAATIGGLSTLIGSPPNLILAGFVEQEYGLTIDFADWMMIGVPLSTVFLAIAWLLLTRVVFPVRITEIAGGRSVITDRLKDMGRMSRGEWTVLFVFSSTALLWVFKDMITGSAAITSVLPFAGRLDDASIAIAAAVALFLIPVSAKKGVFALDWKTVQNGIPWGVLLLFGGGLSIAGAVRATGLSEYIGAQVAGLGVLPTILLVAAVGLIVLMLTELTSNTATAATFLPVLGGVAIGIGVDPLLLLVPAAFAATCSFMLPVGTPPNAIVFGSGQVTIGQMVRAGVWLNLIGIVLITAAVYLLGGPVLGIDF